MSCSLAALNISPLRAARQTSSAKVNAARPSPSAMRLSASRASASSGNRLPSIFSALSSNFSIAAASSDRKTSTRARDKSGALSSKDGFSVVAPTRMMVPSSITGRNESCCARLNRWISSTKSSVPCPNSRRRRASSKTFLRSATPVKIAEICSKCRSVAFASSRATVVLPVPGGPQNTSDPRERVASMRVSAPSAPSKWSCPTTSSSFCGLSLSASGRGASLSRPAAANRLGPPAFARGAIMGDPRRHGRACPGNLRLARYALDTHHPADMPSMTKEMLDTYSSAEHRGNFLPAAKDDDAPAAAGRAGQPLKIARLADGLTIDFLNHVTTLEAEIACIRAGVDVHHGYALIHVLQLQFVGQRRRKIGNLHSGEWRARPNDDFVARCSRSALQVYRHRQFASRPQETKTGIASNRFCGKAVVKSIGIVHVLAIDRDDEIARLDAGASGRAVGVDVGDQCASRALKTHAVGDVSRDRLKVCAKPRPHHGAAAGLGGGDDDAHHVGRNGKAHSLRPTRSREDRCVDSDQFSGQVHKRAARISRIDGSVGLDEEAIVRNADLRAGQRRHDAVGHRLSHAKRIADRQHHVADLHCIRIGKFQDRKLFAPILDAQYGEIGARILQHEGGLELSLIGEGHLHLVRAFDDVIVRHNQSGGVNDYPRAQRALELIAPASRHPEETPEDRIVQ